MIVDWAFGWVRHRRCLSGWRSWWGIGTFRACLKVTDFLWKSTL